MKNPTESLEHASVRQYCKAVRMPTVGANLFSLAEQAVKENHSHIRYLEALLATECEERDRHAISNRIRDAQLPRMKALEEFDFTQAPQIPAARIGELAEGVYIERSEPVVLIGDCGTGKSHLATGLCLAACRQKRRVRFTTAAALVNELVEAKQNNQVRRLMTRWQKYELIALDEVGYVPLADIGAEFLFQVISERAERAAIIVTTNLPFSEWTTVFPNPRLCKALLDRITDRAHIIDTGKESFRFRRTELRPQVEMKRGVADGSKVDEDYVTVGLLQRYRGIDGGGGAACASLGAEESKYPGFAGATETAGAGGTKAGESLEQGLGSGGVVEVLASASAHAGNDAGRMRHFAVGEDSNLLSCGANQFDG